MFGSIIKRSIVLSHLDLGVLFKILFSFFIFQSHLSAQDLLDDLEKMKQLLTSTDKCLITVKLNALDSTDTQVVLLNRAFQTYKNGDAFLCYQGPFTILANTQSTILINNHDKTILVNDGYSSAPTGRALGLEDQMIGDFHDRVNGVDFEVTSSGDKHYRIIDESGMIKVTDIYINSKTGFLKKIEYRYNQELSPQLQKVIIQYSFETNYQLEDSLFSSEYYVSDVGTRLQVSENYRGYQILRVNGDARTLK